MRLDVVGVPDRVWAALTEKNPRPIVRAAVTLSTAVPASARYADGMAKARVQPGHNRFLPAWPLRVSISRTGVTGTNSPLDESLSLGPVK